jgi:hypothetical protein
VSYEKGSHSGLYWKWEREDHICPRGGTIGRGPRTEGYDDPIHERNW